MAAATVSGSVLLDPWTASIAPAAGRRGELQVTDAPEDGKTSLHTRASSEQHANAPASSHSSSLAGKFNLPQLNVLHVLRTAYYGAARISHKQTASARTIATTHSVTMTSVISHEKIQVEEREAKRHKAVGSGNDSSFGTSSRRGTAALRRLCAALGVYTQQAHMPAQHLSYAVASCRGWRVAMEDTYAAEVPLSGTNDAVSLFAVYDGHGGAEVARYSALHMGRAIRDAAAGTAAFHNSPPPDQHLAPAPVSALPDPAVGAPTSPTGRETAFPPAGPTSTVEGSHVRPYDNPYDTGAASRGSAPSSTASSPCLIGLPSQLSRPAAAAAAAAAAGGAGGGSTAAPVTADVGTAAGDFGGGTGAEAASAVIAARAATLRSAFLSLDRQLGDKGQARELMALANPGALTVPPDLYGRRTAGGPFVGPSAGSTATVALVEPRGVTVAGVGDSRCLLGSRVGGVVAMSVDHKASEPGERERVVQAGCWVSASGRVCGELDMSRALGDADMKQTVGLPPHLQAVTAEPSVLHLALEEAPEEEGQQGGQGWGLGQGTGAGREGEGRQESERGGGGAGPSDGGEEEPQAGGGSDGGSGGGDAMVGVEEAGRGGDGGGGGSGGGGGRGSCCYLLIASDGLWNVMDNDKVHEFILERLEARVPAEHICALLCVEACVSDRTAYDNVTVLLVLLHGRRPASGRAALQTAVSAGTPEEACGGAGEADGVPAAAAAAPGCGAWGAGVAEIEEEGEVDSEEEGAVSLGERIESGGEAGGSSQGWLPGTTAGVQDAASAGGQQAWGMGQGAEGAPVAVSAKALMRWCDRESAVGAAGSSGSLGDQDAGGHERAGTCPVWVPDAHAAGPVCSSPHSKVGAMLLACDQRNVGEIRASASLTMQASNAGAIAFVGLSERLLEASPIHDDQLAS